jgi:hypothetical protein
MPSLRSADAFVVLAVQLAVQLASALIWRSICPKIWDARGAIFLGWLVTAFLFLSTAA